MTSGWQRYFPWLTWRNRVNPSTTRLDLIAGLAGAIILVALDVRLDELRCDQLDRVSQGLRLARPVVGTLCLTAQVLWIYL